MPTASNPFYGCLCLETSNMNPLPAVNARQLVALPLPEIHFNIWEGTGTEPFLDIGIMLAVHDPAERIELFLPWILEPANIEDLSPRILAINGVAAIFNEAWTSSTTNNSAGGYVTRTDGSVFAIVALNLPIINIPHHPLGHLHSIVLDVAQLRASSLATVPSTQRQPEQMYVRIRVKNVPLSFYQVGMDQGDALGGGARNRTEIIDFRMNVRRGVPPGIETFLHGRFVEFSKVHLFLMKSRDEDIVFEDKLFKACRSLEDEKFWAEYILPSPSSAETVRRSLKQVQGSLGYQWRKTPENGVASVREFGMLARFKSYKMRKMAVAFFVFLALVLGAMGNGVYDMGKWVYTMSPVSKNGVATALVKTEEAHPTVLQPEVLPPAVKRSRKSSPQAAKIVDQK
jgi:hypothetical protein